MHSGRHDITVALRIHVPLRPPTGSDDIRDTRTDVYLDRVSILLLLHWINILLLWASYYSEHHDKALSISSQEVGEMERRYREQQHKSASVVAEVSTYKVVQVA